MTQHPLRRMKRTWKATLLSLLTVAVVGCSSEPDPAPLPSDDVAAIEALAAAYVEALRAADPAAMAELYAPDAVQMPPNGRVAEGRAAIRAAMEAGPGAFFERLSYWGVRWSLDGYSDGLVYDWGTFGVSVAEDSAEHRFYDGKYLVLLEKQQDGSWRIAREIWTAPRPAEAGDR